jgi:CheY-like chemotaxis protein
VQEYLVDGEYFFSVDTHDDLDVRSDNPDYDAWQELKRFNAALKQRIEAAWARAGLPTHAELRLLAEGLAQVEREARKRARLLVVDDETEVCRGSAALLEGARLRGRAGVRRPQVLERLAREPLPDLVLLDYAMPELDGEEVLARIARDPRLRACRSAGDGLARSARERAARRGLPAQALRARGAVRDAGQLLARAR